jgi:uncharacterized SAM-dependent methyltransferase
MADSYIDYFEIDEYGKHFSLTAKALIGTYDAVKVEVLITDIDTLVATVATELEKAGFTRSLQRGGRNTTAVAVEEARTLLTRFFRFLGSLDSAETSFDIAAFFVGGTLGNISQLKADDLKAKVKQALSGFGADKNKSTAELEPWKKKVSKAYDDLSGSLEDTSLQHHSAGTVTAALQQARLDFLDLYNDVIKPIIRGLLNKLDRSSEYKSFFKDLQVNETPRQSGPTPAIVDDGSSTEPNKA